MTRRQLFFASAVIPCAQREPGATRHQYDFEYALPGR
jgi:hypothetical protein